MYVLNVLQFGANKFYFKRPFDFNWGGLVYLYNNADY